MHVQHKSYLKSSTSKHILICLLTMQIQHNQAAVVVVCETLLVRSYGRTDLPFTSVIYECELFSCLFDALLSRIIA